MVLYLSLLWYCYPRFIFNPAKATYIFIKTLEKTNDVTQFTQFVYFAQNINKIPNWIINQATKNDTADLLVQNFNHENYKFLASVEANVFLNNQYFLEKYFDALIQTNVLKINFIQFMTSLPDYIHNNTVFITRLDVVMKSVSELPADISLKNMNIILKDSKNLVEDCKKNVYFILKNYLQVLIKNEDCIKNLLHIKKIIADCQSFVDCQSFLSDCNKCINDKLCIDTTDDYLKIIEQIECFSILQSNFPSTISRICASIEKLVKVDDVISILGAISGSYQLSYHDSSIFINSCTKVLKFHSSRITESQLLNITNSLKNGMQLKCLLKMYDEIHNKEMFYQNLGLKPNTDYSHMQELSKSARYIEFLQNYNQHKQKAEKLMDHYKSIDALLVDLYGALYQSQSDEVSLSQEQKITIFLQGLQGDLTHVTDSCIKKSCVENILKLVDLLNDTPHTKSFKKQITDNQQKFKEICVLVKKQYDTVYSKQITIDTYACLLQHVKEILSEIESDVEYVESFFNELKSQGGDIFNIIRHDLDEDSNYQRPLKLYDAQNTHFSDIQNPYQDEGVVSCLGPLQVIKYGIIDGIKKLIKKSNKSQSDNNQHVAILDDQDSITLEIRSAGESDNPYLAKW